MESNEIQNMEDLHLEDSLKDALLAESPEKKVERSISFTSALMSIAGTRKRSGRLWLAVLCTLVLVALLLIQVYFRHQVLNVGYALSSAVSQREALLEEERKLRIELRVLSSRDRLEPYARRNMGMSVMRPEQVIYETGIEGGSHFLPTKGRVDGLDKVRKIMDKDER